jgi:Flp pilus assembly protein TadD
MQFTAIVVVLMILLTPSGTPGQGQSMVKRLEHAAALIRDNRVEEAEQELSSVLKVAPNEAVALNLLGTIRARQGRLNDAELFFSRAVRRDPRLVGAHVNLAYLYSLKGEPQKTISEFKEVLRLDPKNTDALDRLARLLLAQGQVDEGIKAIEQAKQSQSL